MAVIYVRFAVLTLVLYLLAHWYFVEYEMVLMDRGQPQTTIRPPPLTSTAATVDMGGVVGSAAGGHGEL